MIWWYLAAVRSLATHWRVVQRGSVIAWVEPHRWGSWIIETHDPVPMYRPDRTGD